MLPMSMEAESLNPTPNGAKLCSCSSVMLLRACVNSSTTEWDSISEVDDGDKLVKWEDLPRCVLELKGSVCR